MKLLKLPQNPCYFDWSMSRPGIDRCPKSQTEAFPRFEDFEPNLAELLALLESLYGQLDINRQARTPG